MSVELKSANKICTGQHYDLIIKIDGQQDVVISSSDLLFLDEPMTSEDIKAAMKVWAKYHKSKNIPLEDLIGKVIFEDMA